MDIVKELDENQTILLTIEGENYNSMALGIAKQLSKKNICYITLNKTYNSLMDIFHKKGIDTKNMVFIDAISRTILSKVPQVDNCYFISSPAALTEMSITLSKFIKLNFDYLIFDSLTNLLVYEKKAPVAKFMSHVISRIKESETKAVFYVLKVSQHQEIIQECSMFVDKVIDASK